MSGGHSGADDIAFFAATLGLTRAIALSTSAAQLATAGGPLPTGRYLLHLGALSDDTAVVWVALRAWNAGATQTLAAAVPAFPLRVSRLLAIEVNVRKEHSDQVVAVLSAGTGTLYVTRISNGA